MSEAPDNEVDQRGMVSAVIPTHNRCEALDRCLESLARQTYRNLEIIVVDDCSSDGTGDLLRQFAEKRSDGEFRWLRNDRNSGANKSRNRGILEARGEFVAFLDSDCVAAPDWIENLVEPFINPAVAAVTGRIEMPPARNIYELTYSGTSQVVGRGYVRRLRAGNMCIRRDLLLRHPLDEDLRYGCDEEGIYLRLRADGHRQEYAPSALVHHEHHFTGRSLMRQAWIGGGGAAWLVYKYHLLPRLDMLPFMLAYASIPLVAVNLWLALIPGLFFTAALSAITYNELFRKRKSVGATLRSFPVLIVYYHVRLLGYVTAAVRLRIGSKAIERVRL